MFVSFSHLSDFDYKHNGAALIARAAPLRSAETVFCFSFQPNEKLSRSGPAARDRL